MLLSDGGIAEALTAGHIEVEDLADGSIQPASVDVRLSSDLLIFGDHGDEVIDPTRRQEDTIAKRVPEQGFIMDPCEFLLGSTEEEITVGAGYAVQFTGKSSLARLGLMVHSTAGHIDPGFQGRITLEITNQRVKPFRLRPRMWIGQLLIFKLDADAMRPYGHSELRSRYMGQSTVTESRSWM
jgi:dCTP deaminase